MLGLKEYNGQQLENQVPDSPVSVDSFDEMFKEIVPETVTDEVKSTGGKGTNGQFVFTKEVSPELGENIEHVEPDVQHEKEHEKELEFQEEQDRIANELFREVNSQRKRDDISINESEIEQAEKDLQEVEDKKHFQVKFKSPISSDEDSSETDPFVQQQSTKRKILTSQDEDIPVKKHKRDSELERIESQPLQAETVASQIVEISSEESEVELEKSDNRALLFNNETQHKNAKISERDYRSRGGSRESGETIALPLSPKPHYNKELLNHLDSLIEQVDSKELVNVYTSVFTTVSSEIIQYCCYATSLDRKLTLELLERASYGELDIENLPQSPGIWTYDEDTVLFRFIDKALIPRVVRSCCRSNPRLKEYFNSRRSGSDDMDIIIFGLKSDGVLNLVKNELTDESILRRIEYYRDYWFLDAQSRSRRANEILCVLDNSEWKTFKECEQFHGLKRMNRRILLLLGSNHSRLKKFLNEFYQSVWADEEIAILDQLIKALCPRLVSDLAGHRPKFMRKLKRLLQKPEVEETEIQSIIPADGVFPDDYFVKEIKEFIKRHQLSMETQPVIHDEQDAHDLPLLLIKLVDHRGINQVTEKALLHFDKTRRYEAFLEYLENFGVPQE